MNRALVLVLWACSGNADPKSQPAAPPTPAPPAAAPKPDKPQVNDKAAEALILKGSPCKPGPDTTLPMDCPELKAIHEYAFQHQGSADVAETCVAFFSDPDRVRRLLAAECTYGLNDAAQTPILHWGLDALETEKDPAVQERMAWGLMGAQAMTAKLDDRVLADVEKLSADPKTAQAGAWLFGTEFKSYLMGEGPKAPAKAQARAIKALREDGTPMMRAAFDVALTKLEDKAAVCDAIDADLDPAFKNWWMAADAIITMKDACVTKLQKAIDLTLDQLTKDWHLELLTRYDSRFDLDPVVRKKILDRLRRTKVEGWKQEPLKKAIDQFAKPPAPKK